MVCYYFYKKQFQEKPICPISTEVLVAVLFINLFIIMALHTTYQIIADASYFWSSHLADYF
jgi:hypothetical protein